MSSPTRSPFFVASLIIAIFIAAGCSQWSNRWSTPSAEDPFPGLSIQEASDQMNYAYIQQNILIPYCISCHGNSGGVSVDNLASIRQNSDKIIAQIIPPNRLMPRGDAAAKMTDSHRRTLYFWLKAGAPQGTAPVALAWQVYPPLSAEDAKLKLNYEYVRDNILIPKCISCHGSAGKVSLEDLASIQANTHGILVATLGVVGASMPKVSMPPAIPARVLTEDDNQVLYNWLTAGAPENSPTHGPTPELPPIQPTFDDINKRILQVRCMDCHDPSKKVGQKHPLDKDGILHHADPDDGPPVTPGNPEGSVIIQTLEQDPLSTLAPMPPTQDKNKKPTGYAKVPQVEIDVIKTWIKNGAKD